MGFQILKPGNIWTTAARMVVPKWKKWFAEEQQLWYAGPQQNERKVISNGLFKLQAPIILNHSTVHTVQSSIFTALKDGSHTGSFSCVTATPRTYCHHWKDAGPTFTRSEAEALTSSMHGNPSENLVPRLGGTSRRGKYTRISLVLWYTLWLVDCNKDKARTFFILRFRLRFKFLAFQF